MSAKRFLLVAGEGRVPILVYQKAKQKGWTIEVASYSFFSTDSELPRDHVMDLFSLDALFSIMDRFGFSHVCLSGKVSRDILLQPNHIGKDVINFLHNHDDWRDGPLLNAIFERIRQMGYQLVSPLDFLQDLLSRPGLMAGPEPSSEAWEDIRFGLPLARMFADQEVGQAIVVERKTVLAVEAAEGTNETIRRGSRFGRGQFVVIKAARTEQDGMIDFPTVGPDTIRVIGNCGGGILALEAGKLLIPDLSLVTSLAEQNQVSLVGVAEQIQWQTT